MATLTIALANQTTSSTVYAYITGQAIDNNNALFLLQSDAKTAYYPTSPSATGAQLAQDVAIPLGAPGSTVNATIPHIAGGRIWFSIGSKLKFLLNPGPALVEPSVTNPSDPNVNIMWDFCEFTWNSSQMYANISYVDFVSIPVALTLSSNGAADQHVGGMTADGLSTVCSGLQAQNSADGAGWDKLIVQSNGQNLRALSPNNGITLNSGLFGNYWNSYVDQVWSKYTGANLTVNTQAQWSNVAGSVQNGNLTFGNISFSKPSSADIFSNSTGPFAFTGTEQGALTARLAAGFNRSTLLIDNNQPEGENPSNYYKNSITNHYARIVHAANVDGRGYAFPYDDVTPTNGQDQSGFVSSGSPTVMTVTVGGSNASAAPAQGSNKTQSPKRNRNCMHLPKLPAKLPSKMSCFNTY
jgi:Beta-1,3-glucanase